MKKLIFALSIILSLTTYGQEIDGISNIHKSYIDLISNSLDPSDGGTRLAVNKNGEIIHNVGYGAIQKQTSAPTATTEFNMASISKQYTGMVIAMLIQEGKINLSDEADKHLDLDGLTLPTKNGVKITIDHLLRHTSGLINWTNSKPRKNYNDYIDDNYPEGTKWSNKNHAEWATTTTLKYTPGSKHKYTNTGYTLLARIIEVIENRHNGENKIYKQIVKERILDVLGMKNTRVFNPRFNGAGNMKSTLEDYLKWDTALWNEDTRLIKKSNYKKLIFSKGTLNNGGPLNYGFGWRVEYDGNTLKSAFHGGGGKTTANHIRRYFGENNNITVVFFRNGEKTFNKYPASNPDVKYKQSFTDEILNFVKNN